jgi:hypothetical protein
MKNREQEVTLPSGDDSATVRRDLLRSERVAQIRIRVRSGAYNTAAVVDAVARNHEKRRPVNGRAQVSRPYIAVAGSTIAPVR